MLVVPFLHLRPLLEWSRGSRLFLLLLLVVRMPLLKRGRKKEEGVGDILVVVC